MRSALIAVRVRRGVRAGGVAAVLAAAAAMAAPGVPAAAAGQDHGTVSVDPHRAAPGAQVKVHVTGCKGRWAVAKSSVFVSDVHLSAGHGSDKAEKAEKAEKPGGADRADESAKADGAAAKPLWGDAVISSRARPGRHEVTVRCEADELRGSVEVVPHAEGRDTRPEPHKSPVHPVHAGGGGMAAEVADASRITGQAAAARKGEGEGEGGGPGLPHTVVGAVLAAAATLAVAGRALVLRRRRSGE
ncbi:hypothetical protein ACIQV2_04835 [Streptomyces globosus]|uniref:hypothetical protein n=1 Tax=Streptomyces TaxID=1883 RepID=UPI000F74089D|nr:hypothetical protein [Streptomyces sp. WAC05292]RSS81720.1 hypothetical protein EF903_28415 [Streptomyces sp. WAC05292]